MIFGKYKHFSDISPACYELSEKKEILRRHLQDLRSKEHFAAQQSRDKLPEVIYSHHSQLLKRGKGIDPVLQENKAVNIGLASAKMNGLIIHPGETYSFWRLVGKVTEKKGYKNGRVLLHNKLIPGTGGGLCNLANTINLLILHSPLEITEFHTHSDALAPDPGERIPFSAGTSVSYNYIDYRFKNTTDQDFQLLIWCQDDQLWGELRCEHPIQWEYKIAEEDHHFHPEGTEYYRVSKIYRDTYEKDTGTLVDHKLVWNNHSLVMFDHELLPKDSIR